MASQGWRVPLLACFLLQHVCILHMSGFASAQGEAVNHVATLSIVQNTSAIATIGAGDLCISETFRFSNYAPCPSCPRTPC